MHHGDTTMSICPPLAYCEYSIKYTVHAVYAETFGFALFRLPLCVLTFKFGIVGVMLVGGDATLLSRFLKFSVIVGLSECLTLGECQMSFVRHQLALPFDLKHQSSSTLDLK